MQYHTYAPGESQMHLKSCRQRLCVMAGLLRYLTSVWVEMDCAPSEVKQTVMERLLQWALNRTLLAKSTRAKYLPVAD